MKHVTGALILESTKNHDKVFVAQNLGQGHRGHNASLKKMTRTITKQGLTLAAITASQKHTFMLDST